MYYSLSVILFVTAQVAVLTSSCAEAASRSAPVVLQGGALVEVVDLSIAVSATVLITLLFLVISLMFKW